MEEPEPSGAFVPGVRTQIAMADAKMLAEHGYDRKQATDVEFETKEGCTFTTYVFGAKRVTICRTLKSTKVTEK